MSPQHDIIIVLFVYSAVGDVIGNSTSEEVRGCTYVRFLEYNADATVDDGSCATYLGTDNADSTQPRSVTDHGKTGFRTNCTELAHAFLFLHSPFISDDQ